MSRLFRWCWLLPALFAASAAALGQGSDSTPATRSAVSTERSLANGALKRARIESSGAADVKHGERIVLGTACKAGQICGCFQCHRVRGQGDAAAGFPRIGGQSYLYLYESLRNFAAGRRQNPIMQPIAAQLSDRDMRDVAAYYAVLEPPSGGAQEAAAAKNSPDAERLIEGGVLAAMGSAKDGVQACQNCHGPAGAGLPPVYPFLGGQYAKYLEDQLQAFKSGKRGGDAFAIMQDIARRLSDDQIDAVSHYYASIRPQPAVSQTQLGSAVQIGAPLGPHRAPPRAPASEQGHAQ